jgi:hypothetical protein
VAAGQGAGDPTHLPSETLVEFVGIGQIAIGEDDDYHADGEGDEHDEREAAERGGTLPVLSRCQIRAGHISPILFCEETTRRDANK